MNIEEIDATIDKLDENIEDEDQKQRLEEMHKNYKGSDEVVTADKYKELITRDKVLYEAGSGIFGLDEIVKGFRPGTVVIISGPTKQGKTTFCQTLTNNFTEQGYNCLWFSFDTPPIEVIERFVKLPVFYLPKKNMPEKKVSWIENKIIESLVKYNTRIVFIDHLGFLGRFSTKSDNEATQLTSIVRELKEISIRWNVTIFLNHHIRSVPADITPDWSHLKDSSGPAQESDLTIMVWRAKQKTEMGIQFDESAFVSVQLHRRTGRTGTIKVGFKDNLFYDLDRPIGDQKHENKKNK